MSESVSDLTVEEEEEEIEMEETPELGLFHKLPPYTLTLTLIHTISIIILLQ